MQRINKHNRSVTLLLLLQIQSGSEGSYQLPAAALHHFASDPAILTNRSMMGGVAALRMMLCCLVGG